MIKQFIRRVVGVLITIFIFWFLGIKGIIGAVFGIAIILYAIYTKNTLILGIIRTVGDKTSELYAKEISK